MHRSIRSRRAAGYLGVIVLLVVAWAISALIGSAVRANYAHTVDTLDALANNVLLRAKLQDDQETGLRGYLLTGQRDFLQPYLVAQRDLPAIRRAGDKLAAGEPEVRPLLVTLRRRALAWEHWAQPLVAQPVPAGRETAATIARQRVGKQLFDLYRAMSTRIIQDLDTRRGRELRQSLDLLDRMNALLVALFAGGIITLAWIGGRTILDVTRPLEQLAQAAAAIGRGDLAHPIALDSAEEFSRLGRGMDRMRRRLGTQQAIAALVGSTLQLDEVYAEFAASVRELVPYDTFSLTVGAGDGDGAEMVTAYAAGAGATGHTIGVRRPVGATITGHVYRTGRLMVRHDIATLPPAQLFVDERLGLAAGLHALACLPMLAKGRVVATLTLGSRQPGLYDEQSLGPIIALAPLVAAALDNATLYNSLQDTLRELREREEQLRSVTETAHDAIITASGSGTILSWNGGARAIFGYDAREVLHRPLALLMPARYRDAHLKGLDRVTATGESRLLGRTIELHGLTKDGTEFPLELSLATWMAGDARFFSGIMRDITARKQAEAELLQAREAALEASRLKSEFLASMSHEIRTPMSGVIGMTELLLETELSAEQRDYALTVRESGQALLTIINDILDFSKIEAGKLTLESVDFALGGVVEGTAELLAPKIREKQLTAMTYVAPELPGLVRGDPGRIRQVLLNLMGNAVKFTERGEVVVRATAERVHADRIVVRVAVRDTGIGLTNAARARLFQPFTQADGSTTRKYGGTGLGLSISRRLVELMGGEIGVESVEGQGSTFWFTVPLGLSPAAALPEPPAAHVDLQGLRVLVVDDRAADREIIQSYLLSWNMRVTAVTNGADALRLLRQEALGPEPFAVALLDLALPDMDGFAVARAIQSDPALDAIRLILLTAFDTRGQGEQVLRAGFCAYLTKPIKRSYLLDALATAMQPAAPAPAAPPPLPASRPTPAQVAAPGAAPPRDRLILLAEDNPTNQKLIVRQLQRLGYATEVVVDGRAAVAAVAHTRYALVLMDCQMPEMDGYAATRAIRKAEVTSGRRVPVVALTAHAMDGDRETCLAAGMDDYLTKPVSPDDLRAALQRWAPSSAPPVAAGAPAAQEPAAPAEMGPALDQRMVAGLRELGDAGFVVEVIDTYLAEASRLWDTLRAAAARGDGEAISRAAHGMAGMSANVGATALPGLCHDLERLSRDGATAAVDDLLARLGAEHRRVSAALEAERQRGRA